MTNFRTFLSLLLSTALITPSWTSSEAAATTLTNNHPINFETQALSVTLISSLHPLYKKASVAIWKKISWTSLENHLESRASFWTHLVTWPMGLGIAAGSILLPYYGYGSVPIGLGVLSGLSLMSYRRLLQTYSRHGGYFPYYISVRDPLRDILEWLVVQVLYETYPLRTGRRSHDEPLSPDGSMKLEVLMSYPRDFNVPWSINVHMHPGSERVYRIRAARQWENLVQHLRDNGVLIREISMQPQLADMVFTANGGLVGLDAQGQRVFIPPHFTNEARQGETAVFTDYMKKLGYVIKDVADEKWEGEGDTLPLLHEDDRYGTIRFGGFGDPKRGFRSNIVAQDKAAKVLSQHFVGLELVDPRFYHLDTAFCPLGNGRSVLYYPGAFSPEGRTLIKKYVSDPIELTEDEAVAFSANAIPVGNKVFMNAASPRLVETLRLRGIEAISTPMTEFLKSGGSCKCTALFLSVKRSWSNTWSSKSGSLDEYATSTFYNGVVAHRQEAAKSIGYDHLLPSLLKPYRDITAEFTFRRDDGSWSATQTGWRILSGKPGKGGIRAKANLVKADVAALNLDMDTKIPEGITVEGQALRGGKGGMTIDFHLLTRHEKIRAIRAYVDAMMDAVWLHEGVVAFGPLFDIPAPDVGTSTPDVNLMDYFADEALQWQVTHADAILPWLKQHDRQTAKDLQTLIANKVPSTSEVFLPYADRVLELKEEGKLNSLRLLATVTGKSLPYGGIAGRSTSTGLGMAYTLFEYMKAVKLIPEHADRIPHRIRVAVEGYGNVGYGAAIAFLDIGLELSAIAEYDRATRQTFALYAPHGFDRPLLEAMKQHQREFGTLYDFSDSRIQRITTAEFWSLPMDVFAPSAAEEAIKELQARLLRPRTIVVEGANGATTPRADTILHQQDVTVLPDVVANSGGVLVSWMEILQNIIPDEPPWAERTVNDYLHYHVRMRIIQLVDYAGKHGGISLREAVHDVSLELRARPWIALREAA